MGRYLVERYFPVTAGELLGDEAERLTAASVNGARLLWTMYSPEDETCFFLFDAPEAGAVQAAARVAGVGLDRVVAVIEIQPSEIGRARELKVRGSCHDAEAPEPWESTVEFPSHRTCKGVG